jgi:hypothetical protein
LALAPWPWFEPTPLATRLWSRVAGPWSSPEVGDTDCWEWCGRWHTRFGHGRIQLDGGRGARGVPASRVAYELTFGPIPSGTIVRHKCDRASCCNPAHLQLGTERDNYRDRQQRRRFVRKRGRFAATIYEREFPNSNSPPWPS